MTRSTRSRAGTTRTPATKVPPADEMAPTTRAVKAVASVTTTAVRATKKRPVKDTASTITKGAKVAEDVDTPKKKRKLAAPKAKVPAAPVEVIPPPTPRKPKTGYAPLLIPPTLTFSLPAATAHLSTHDPRFGSFFAQIPCKPFQPPLEAIEPFKTLVTSIIGQQVSWMAARAITKRFKESFGYSEDDGSDGFPSPEDVAKEDVMRLKGVGLSLRKAEYVICLAEHFVDGRLSTELLRDGTDEEIAEALIAVRGIGRWTVDMFLMFSLRRPDVLPVGDLGVQKGLIRWILSGYDALPKPKQKRGKVSEEAKKKYGLTKKEDSASAIADKVNINGEGEIDTLVVSDPKSTPPPFSPSINGQLLPPTPLTPNSSPPHIAVLHTPGNAQESSASNVPGTPLTPAPNGYRSGKEEIKPEETFETEPAELPPPAPESLLSPPTDGSFDPKNVLPLPDGLSVEVLKSRLGGKKVKGGAYLTPQEMEELTSGWRPYRSLGVYHMWPAGEEL